MQPAKGAFYVMGPSGSGKDTLIQRLQSQLGSAVSVPPRYIDRPYQAGQLEQHYALSSAVFSEFQDKACFSLSWAANQHRYGYDRQWLDDVAQGKLVLLNGSRAHWPQAQQQYPQLLPIMLSLPEAEQKNRLQQRGREDATAIAARLARSATLTDAGIAAECVLNAAQSPEAVLADCLQLLHHHRPSLCL
ncbi:MAG: AAA family ATPase [Neisseriaceae bacterium]|nr:AAA family ATPase [Neisseriaceae bacterium]MBP6861924.1 AAA family ATPase [Neisseriaceae bacterium]